MFRRRIFTAILISAANVFLGQETYQNIFHGVFLSRLRTEFPEKKHRRISDAICDVFEKYL